jgi:hypothetical protein
MLTPVACEIDMIDHWPRTLAGMIGSQFAACVDTLKTALANSGVWPDIAFHVNPDSNADDVAWFASHAHRTHRLRVAAIDEFILSVSGASPAHCVIVQQIAPGTRLIVAIPDGMTSLRVEPQPFTDDADDHYTDRDVFLECLFGALCQDPGQVIDVSRIIEHVKVISWRAEAQGYFEHDSCQEHCGSVGAIVMAIEALRGERPE